MKQVYSAEQQLNINKTHNVRDRDKHLEKTDIQNNTLFLNGY